MNEASPVKEVRTHPCPRCSSLRTRACVGNADEKIYWRFCMDCSNTWDVAADHPRPRPEVPREDKRS